MVTFLSEGWFDEHADPKQRKGGRKAGMAAGQLILTTCGLDAVIIYNHHREGMTDGMRADNMAISKSEVTSKVNAQPPHEEVFSPGGIAIAIKKIEEKLLGRSDR